MPGDHHLSGFGDHFVDIAGVTGPSSGTSTDNAIVRWDGTTASVLQDSSILIDDSDNITGLVNLAMTGSIGTTGARVVKGWFTDITVTNFPTVDALTAGSVLFGGASGVIAQDNASLFWDDTTNRFGIGTATPAASVDVSIASLTDGIAHDISDADDLTTGGIFNYVSNSSSTGTRILGTIHNDHADATGTTVLKLIQDSTGLALDITGNATIVGDLGLTGTRVTKGWFTDLESTNMPTVGGTSIQDTFVDVAGDTMTGQLFIDGGADEVQLLVQGNATQTNQIFRVEGSANEDYFDVIGDGKIGVGTTAALANQDNPVAKFSVKGDTTDNTAASFIVTNSGGTSLFYVRNDGAVGLGSLSKAALSPDTFTTNFDILAGQSKRFGFYNQSVAIGMYATSNNIRIQGNTVALYSGFNTQALYADTSRRVIIGVSTSSTSRFMVDGYTDAVQCLIQGHSTQTSNLVEHQSSASANLSGFDGGGVLFMAETTTPSAVANFGKLYPKADNRIYWQDGAGTEKTLHDSDDTIDTLISLETYDAEPARGSETNLHGGFLSLATGQPLDSVPTNIVVTKGIGKIVIVINAGSDISGSITITGESIDRDTGASTPADTDTITVDALTTDGSDTDGNGNTRHSFTGAYISSKWFTGTVTLSTADLTLTDVDVYHVSFEQFNDSPNITLNTFDANIFTTNVNAEFDAYLYCLEVTGDKCDISRSASLNVGTDGETAIANKYWRLRRGNINTPLDGTTDGVWVDVHYSNSPAYVEDVSIKVWATKTQLITLV